MEKTAPHGKRDPRASASDATVFESEVEMRPAAAWPRPRSAARGTAEIVVIEPSAFHKEHSVVNAGIGATLRRAFPDAAIRLMAEPSHIEMVRPHLDPADERALDWTPIALPPRFGDFRARLAGDIRNVGAALATEPALLVVLAALPSVLWALRLWQWRGRGRATRVHAVLHGNLAEIAEWRPRNPLRRALSLASALSLGGRGGPRFVVLERAIATEAGRILPGLAGRLDVLPHPIAAGELGEARAPAPPLRFGFLGLATEAKGFPRFVELARAVKARAGARARFETVGWSLHGLDGLDLSPLDIPPRSEGFARSDYVAAVSALDYACLPFDDRHYRLSASGVLLDALARLKPIIGLKQPLLADLFSEHGDLGHLCADMAEMTETVARLVERPDPERYAAQVAALSKARAARLPQALAPAYGALVAGAWPDSAAALSRKQACRPHGATP